MASLLGPVAGNTAQADKSAPATTTAKPDRSPPSKTRLDSGAITDRPRTVNRTNASAKYAGFIVLSPAFRCASFEPTLVAFPTSIGQKQYSQPHLHRNPIGRLSRVKEVNDLLTGVLRALVAIAPQWIGERNSAQWLTFGLGRIRVRP